MRLVILAALLFGYPLMLAFFAWPGRRGVAMAALSPRQLQQDRPAAILLIVLGCAVLAWYRVYEIGLIWGVAETITLGVGTIASGIVLLMRWRHAVFISILIGVTMSVLAIAAWAPRIGEVVGLSPVDWRPLLASAWALILCYVPALAFFAWRAWRLPKPQA
jgi:hypothetical protein